MGVRRIFSRRGTIMDFYRGVESAVVKFHFTNCETKRKTFST